MNVIWLVGMIVSYLVCILTIIGGGGDNSINSNNYLPITVSSTLSDEKTQHIIFASMLSMGFFTILYEYDRKDKDLASFMAILLLLIGIYGVILIEETHQIHYVFASTAFISIIVFMFRNMSKNNKYDIFLCSANVIVFSLLILSIIFDQENTSWIGIFGYEIVFLILFTIFYFILHFRSINE